MLERRLQGNLEDISGYINYIYSEPALIEELNFVCLFVSFSLCLLQSLLVS